MKKEKAFKGEYTVFSRNFLQLGPAICEKCPPLPEHMEKKERSSVINKARIHSLYAIIMGFFPEHA
jgi:hypothetical protein